MNKEVNITEELAELVRSVTNRGIIFELVKDTPHAPMVVATLLEDNFRDYQEIIKACIVEEE